MKFNEIENYSYVPLPDYLTIKESNIHGLGLFTLRELFLGEINFKFPSHFELNDSSIIRTPLGGFVNHSENYNCKITIMNPYDGSEDILNYYYLQPIKNIEKGEELTVDYNKYDFCKNKCKN